MRSKEVDVHWKSLNQGDVFILDVGTHLYLWVGSSANLYEKTNAMQLIHKIRDEDRDDKSKIVLMSEEPDCTEFWTTLGDPKGKAQNKISKESQDDADFLKQFEEQLQLLRSQNIRNIGGKISAHPLDM